LKFVRCLWAPLLFAAIVLALNPHWFQAPIVESSDFAANSLQVYHAKIFREMLGNYSRWEFHHPGPAIFYLLAAGERVFHDWTHLVPGTMNAQLVTLVLINTAFLFGAIGIFAKYFKQQIFRPVALAAALLWIYTVNTTVPAGAVVSAWMPHVALFAFLFFAAACASVAAGRIAHLPWLALGAMLMVHLHVAQLLFAGVLSAAACTMAAVGEWRAGTRFGRHWKAIAASVGIVALFLLPMVLELAVHRPNNLDDIRAYLARYPDPHRGLGSAVRYFVSFLAFEPDAVQARIGGQSSPLYLGRTPLLYWAIYLAALGAAVWVAARRAKAVPRIVWIVAGECMLISLLFLYWANRITGDFYNFNGFFIYGIQLLGLFAIVGVLSAEWRAKWAWVVPFAAMPLMAAELRNPDRGSDAIARMSEELRGAGPVRLVFEHGDWDTAAGIANQLARRGQAFCVDPGWFFLFEREAVCRPGTEFARRVVTGAGIFEPGRRPLGLPVRIGADEASALREGFYVCEADHCWTGRSASLGFTLAGEAPAYRVTITGSVLPERPVEVGLNGVRLGVLDGLWKSSASFDVAGSRVNVGGMNRLTLECAGAGPIAGDARELGFSLMMVEISGSNMGHR
jgi:hypothetical protein